KMKYRNDSFLGHCITLGLTVLLVFLSAPVFSQTYLNPKASVEARVQDLLSRMTLDEKIGQMVQTERNYSNVNSVITNYFLGSILSGGGSSPGNSALDWVDMYNGMQRAAMATRLKIPIIYGIDAVHGHNNLYGATIFPHNIGMGCTRDTLLVEKCAAATAMEVRASGLNWTFSPCIAVARDIRWGRTYESFGETPEVVSMMAGPAVRGYQGDTLGTPYRILACAKHFVADGGTQNGINAGNAVMSETTLRQIHLPGYIKAIQAGVGSIMVSFSQWNGVYCHANKYLITDLLKGELGFKGFVVSDWEGIHNISDNFKTSVKLGVNAGIDMFMEPNKPLDFINDLKELVSEDSVSMDRINDAVSRILTAKFKLGLFENPYASSALIDSIGNKYHRELARQAVRESLVLLKNENNLLPLSKVSGNILVAGEKANDLGAQCGGWTISWQGSLGEITKGTTILQAIQNVRGSAQVIYSANGLTSGKPDVAVVVVGESPYAESAGDNPDPTLGTDDIQTIENVKSLGIPYVVLLLSGRPLIINNVLNDAQSVVACWLPGTEGEGIADVLFGDYDFTGKLSQTWPNSISQEPMNWGDVYYQPLFPYGYGLTYGTTGVSHLKQPSFTVYPNPAVKFINVRSVHGGTLEIYDLYGRRVLSTNLDTQEQNININGLNTGMYIVKFTSKSGKVSESRFVKQGS
ncbi:MAG: glycoside hydrolase family 3 C-terminal domain-containing protein, partial [Bacteroidales bacterium]|nr:glycoside hydrolase family 3 C-terminal domain-containing protein [Bacteroidales bacterium]